MIMMNSLYETPRESIHINDYQVWQIRRIGLNPKALALFLNADEADVITRTRSQIHPSTWLR